MTRLLIASVLCVSLSGCAAITAEAPAVSISAATGVEAYSLSPIMDGNRLAAVSVDIDLVGDADGVTMLDLPSEFAEQGELWRHLSEIRIDGALAISGEAGQRLITHEPNSALHIHYRVDSAYDETPRAYAKGGAIIRPDWFAGFGDALFATVAGRALRPASFVWKGWPSGWNHISDLDHGSMGRAMTQDDIVESSLLAGPDIVLLERPITGGVLRYGQSGAFSFVANDFADILARVLSVQRDFWGDVDGPFTVTLYALQDIASGSSAGGTGRSDGFALEATPDIELARLTRILAHEHVHTWVPRRLGELPKTDEQLDYWISEGVTDFYTGRTLLGTGIWTQAQFADDLNEMLQAYAGSSVRKAPNVRIAVDFWNDPEVGDLPYQRGRLFAMLVDHDLRRASDGRVDYDDLLQIMRDSWKLAPAEAKPQLRASFINAARQLGLDIEPMIERVIEEGAAIALPADIYGDCGTLQRVTVASFEPGFDRATSSASNIITGVVSGSPAAKAGLRDGMKRIAYVSSKEGDSRVPMAYRIADTDGERVLSWLPAGTGEFSFEELILSGDGDSSACAALMSGTTDRASPQ